MKSVKQFLIIFLVVYVIGATFGVVMFGPPGISETYMQEHRGDHELYREILSSDWYKRHAQSPATNPLSDAQAESLAYVESYEAREEFQYEEHRAHLFEMYFEFYNALAFTILALGLAWKPLMGLLDKTITEHRERIDAARLAKEEAAVQMQHAEQHVQNLPNERNDIEAQADTLAQREQSEIEEATATVLEHMQSEIEDRCALEGRNAAMAAREAIVNQAIAAAEQSLRDGVSPDRERALIEEFGEGLEKVI